MAALVAVLGACGEPTPDDAQVHSALINHRDGAEVTFNATLVSEPGDANGHERMRVRTGLGDTLEVDHNTSLARRVPAHTGDRVTVHGRLYIDPGGQGVHCTHTRTSGGCPEPGWIKFDSELYA